MGYRNLLTALLCLVLSGTRAQSADTLVVHFDFNQSILLPEERVAIDQRVGRFAFRISSIGLSGHCDSIGGDRYNDSLSRQRIAAVRQYLHSKGVTDTLFKILQPYGRRRPLNDNGDEEKRSRNRRVMILFSLQPPALSPLRKAMLDTAGIVGRNIVLTNVLFYGDMHRPLPMSFRALQELDSVMKEHPHLRIEIQGYVCCGGEDFDGYDIESKKGDLSVQRAKTVYAWLIDHGVDSTRMSYKGFGGRNKIFPQELNETQRTVNRRVEIKVLSW
jgi:outer membrane protein OmpA-like peptidoglycan-associated protein